MDPESLISMFFVPNFTRLKRINKKVTQKPNIPNEIFHGLQLARRREELPCEQFVSGEWDDPSAV